MMNQELQLNPNPLVAYLEKPAAEFTKADIIDYITEHNNQLYVSRSRWETENA